MPNFYALLVGINDYAPASKVNPLTGCLNDIDAYEAFFRQQYKGFLQKNTDLKVLRNAEATYTNVINTFQTHLGQAKTGDIALFVFCGHGAQELTAPEYKQFFPDGKGETLVCYDSRLPTGQDLADKELAVLLHELNQTAHIVCILDCCHSGSGTRTIADNQFAGSRRVATKDMPRPYETYFFANQYPKGAGLTLPKSTHILLAACRAEEEARELTNQRGFFSTCLLQTIASDVNQSYANLFMRSRIAMENLGGDAQHPQFETYNGFEAGKKFLQPSSDAPVTQQFPIAFNQQKRVWEANIGAVQGLPTRANQPSQFTVFEGNTKKGIATTQKVGVQRSLVSFDFEENSNVIYNATLLSLPSTPIDVIVEPANDVVLKENLAKIPLIYANIVPNESKNWAYKLTLQGNKVTISDRNMVVDEQIATVQHSISSVLQESIGNLDVIGRWEKLLKLKNDSSKIQENAIIFWFEQQNDEGAWVKIDGDEVLVDLIHQKNNDYKPVKFRLNVTNNAPRNLNCALFYFSRKYGISTLDNRLIPQNTTATLYQDDIVINDVARMNSTDIFKLLFSTEKIDDFLVIQHELHDISRDLANNTPREMDDWNAKTIIVKATKKKDEISAKDLTIANGGIVIKAHSSFKATVTTRAAVKSSRDIDNGSALADALLRMSGNNNAMSAQLVTFGDNNTRSLIAPTVASPNVLEISQYINPESLAKKPLKIELNLPLNDNEVIMPVTFDGQYFVPVGEVKRNKKRGKVEVKITTLPPSTDNHRSLMGSVKMLFVKMVFGVEAADQLRWVDFSDKKAIKQVNGGVTEKVAAAKKIALVIHGIIGNTQHIAEFMRDAITQKRFDLVLSFDYENLNTPINESSLILKNKLAEAGLKEGCGKEFTIISHSMGGLVSRYMIEKLDASKFVTHLIMAGTPNGGSPMSKITEYRNIASALMGLSMNFGLNLPFTGLIVGILNGSKFVTKTLEMMNYDDPSGFLKTLNAGGDPMVKYTIVAGSIEQYEAKYQANIGLMDKMFGIVANAFNGEKSNDIAVRVLDIEKVLPDAKTFKPVSHQVPCHHLNYFEEKESVKTLYSIL
jgi:Caspase domain